MRCLIAVLACASGGCGLLLDLGGDAPPEKHDAGVSSDASTLDAETADARTRFDAAVPDGGRSRDTGGLDAPPSVADARAIDAGRIDPETCEGALAMASEVLPGSPGMEPTCGGLDIVDFECFGSTSVPEAYFYVDLTTEMTVSISTGAGADAFTFSLVDPTDCSLIDCGHSELSLPAGGRAFFAVEHFGGGCGISYTLSATPTSPAP